MMNIFRKASCLACALCALTLTAPASAEINITHTKSLKLDEEKIAAFVQEITYVMMGRNESMGEGEILTYLNNHIADDGEFKSTLQYQVPGYPDQAKEFVLGKGDYIAATLQSMGGMQDFETSIDISDIRMNAGRSSATMKTISNDRGKITIQGENGPETVPVTGQTSCTQVVKVNKGTLQMSAADCQTLIKFDAWQGQPLESEW